MDAALRLARALDADRRAGPQVLPDRLVRAATVALPVDGAGLSLCHDEDRRVPLAVSSEIVATAERLEFTTGCGPGLAATGSGLPVFATEALLARRWPVFHDLLVTRTALRSILALPLTGPFRGLGAMDLYFRDPDGPTAIDLVDARRIGGLVAGQLEMVAERSAGTGAAAQAWLATPLARRRSRLWMAVGMVVATFTMSAEDALALLRGHAYASEQTVDDLADDLVERRSSPEVLRGTTPRPPALPTARAGTTGDCGRAADRRSGDRQGRGARVVSDARPDCATWDGHVLLVYDGEHERRAGLTAWVRRGLERGEKVVCVETAVGPGEPPLAELGAEEVDVAAARRDGRLDVVAAEQLPQPEGPRGIVRRALTEGFPAVRLSVDARAGLAVLPRTAHRERERRCEELSRTGAASVLCQYARPAATGTELEDLVAAHLNGVRQATFAAGGSRDGVVLRGEIDTANADVFTAVLAAADRAASGALSLDLTGVTYLDAGAGRRLTDATRRFREAGGQVRLVAAQPPVERTLRLLDVGRMSGMDVVGVDR